MDEVEEEIECVKYNCHLRSAPGMWAHYSGDVEVFAPKDADEDELFQRAVKRLASTSFRDRPSLSSWIFEGSVKV